MPMSSLSSRLRQIGRETTGPVILDDMIGVAGAEAVKAMNIQLDPAGCQAHMIEYYGEGPHVAQCSLAPGHDGEHSYVRGD